MSVCYCNWLDCTDYSTWIMPEKRKILVEKDSGTQKHNPNSRLVQNILNGLVKSGHLVKSKKQTMKNYKIKYQLPFTIS